MPSLNGWLLGYPVVYLVGSYEEAAAASRALSMSQLHRFCVALVPAALPAQQLGSGGGERKDALMAFTVPQELHTPELDAATAGLVASISHALESSSGTAFPSGLWQGPPTLFVEAAGPGAVSL
jgi:hypothetical protein